MPEVSITLAVYNLPQIFEVTESATMLFADVEPVNAESCTSIFLIIKPLATKFPVTEMLPETVPIVNA